MREAGELCRPEGPLAGHERPGSKHEQWPKLPVFFQTLRVLSQAFVAEVLADVFLDD
jgi:hypothetical protein